MFTIGVDIGGMSIKVGLVDKAGRIFAQNKVKTEKTAEKCINNLVRQINSLLSENNLLLSDIDGIGIGCPGAVNSETGVVDILPNLNWINVPLVEILKKDFNLPINISNDANVAVLGESIYGVAKGAKTCVMFTIGTGIGGGVIVDGKLFEGYKSRGAELGHSTLILDGEPCTCGRKGCIERYASATALISQTKKAMLTDRTSAMWEYVGGKIDLVDGKCAFECAKKGDKTANKVVDTYVYYLSESMLSMFNIFRPEIFVLGGGISAQGDYLIDKVKAYCEKFNYGYESAPRTEILTASLGNDAGIIGASALIR